MVPTVGEARFIAYSDVYGDVADETDQITEMARMLRKFFAYLTSFTSRDTVLVKTVVTVKESKRGADVTKNTIRLRA